MSIKFSKQNISNKTVKLVSESIKSGWLTHGENTKKFELEFKKYTKSKFAITVSSCTAGLHLSCLAAGFKRGDEVIVPAMSHTATSHAVEYTGATVKFVDVDLYNGNISTDQIIKNINKKTKGIIIVHMSGFPCYMNKIMQIVKKFNLKLIEDCAHGLGTKYNNQHVGNFGITGCFSFYPTKQITTGEGGMVITNNKKIYNLIKTTKAFGIDKDIKERKKPGIYDVKRLGFNYRMTDFQAALGIDQIKNYSQNLMRRHKNAKIYYNEFKKNKNIITQEFDKKCSYFVFQIFVKDRDKILSKLKKNNIQYSIHYAKTLPSLNYYKIKYFIKEKNFTNADLYAKTNISLPIYPKLSTKEIKKICSVINE